MAAPSVRTNTSSPACERRTQPARAWGERAGRWGLGVCGDTVCPLHLSPPRPSVLLLADPTGNKRVFPGAASLLTSHIWSSELTHPEESQGDAVCSGPRAAGVETRLFSSVRERQMCRGLLLSHGGGKAEPRPGTLGWESGEGQGVTGCRPRPSEKCREVNKVKSSPREVTLGLAPAAALKARDGRFRAGGPPPASAGCKDQGLALRGVCLDALTRWPVSLQEALAPLSEKTQPLCRPRPRPRAAILTGPVGPRLPLHP